MPCSGHPWVVLALGPCQAGEEATACVRAVQHVWLHASGWALLPWGQGYVQIIPVLMDHRGMNTRWMSWTAGLPCHSLQ